MTKLSEKYKKQNFEEIKDQKVILDYYKDKDSKGILSVYSQEEVHRRIVNLFMNQLNDLETLYKDHKPILNKLKEILLLDKLIEVSKEVTDVHKELSTHYRREEIQEQFKPKFDEE